MKRSPVLARISLITRLALSVAALACQTQPDRHLGDSLEDRSLDLLPATEPTEPFGVSPLEFVGRWVGVAEEPLAFGGVAANYSFPSGSTAFSFELVAPEVLTEASLRGTITFGSGAPPSAPDPEIGYPSDVDYSMLAYFDSNALSASGYEGPLPPYEGYPYPLREAVLSHALGLDEALQPIIADGVLQLEFDTALVLSPWCELQEPKPNSSGDFGCLEDFGALADDAGQCFVVLADSTFEQVDCNKLFVCSTGFCNCTESGCGYTGANRRSSGRLILRRDGDTLTGVFTNTAFLNARQLPVPLGTVRFTRVQD
jgi:hypothetical protein